jgi:uncharacterized protein YdhG (YjbR/CyaY superfamily)
MPAPKNVEEYLAKLPEEVQMIMQNIRKLIMEDYPEAKEMITYLMPTYEFNGKRLYVAANKKHIGFYAIYNPTDFEDEIASYRAAKDTVRFALNEPIPYGLIRKLINLKLSS